MKITVLNGSPKGDQSVTMQYVHFMQQHFPQHELKILNIAQQIKKIEEHEQAFQEILDAVKASDGVLWAFPLYYMLVQAHYKRFIELLWERNAQDVFKEKYAAVLTTSIHFYDHTAHNYLHAICDDLGMKYVDSYSAAMDDLLQASERKRLLLFAENFLTAIETAAPTFKQYPPVSHQPVEYASVNVAQKVAVGAQKVVIVTDSDNPQTNLGKMIARLKQSFDQEVAVYNLSTMDIKGSCLGCIQCGYDNTCIWEGKDDYIEFFKTKVQPADVLIFAGTIQDRYLSARWKTFFDRSFFNGHIPVLGGKQFGYLISGPLSQISNLREIFEAYTESQHSNLVDIITDEQHDSTVIDAMLQSLAERLIRLAEQQYLKPATYLSIGGAKIFRDGVWGHMRFVFQADHKFYKQYGMYDFPQKDYKTRLLNIVMPVLLQIPAFRKRFYTQEMKPGMVRPFQKVLAQV
jgi:multimeric flavodoxin WrbA